MRVNDFGAMPQVETMPQAVVETPVLANPNQFFDFEKAQELLCTFGCDAALSEFFENAIVSNFVEFIDGGNGRRFEGFVDPRDGDHGSQNASIVDVNGEFVEV